MNNPLLKYLPAIMALFFLTNNLFGQELRKSTTYIDTYYHGEKHFSIKDGSYVFYNPGNGELYVAVNFCDLKCGVDSLDEWLLDLTDTKLIFKGHLPSNDLLLLTHHNTKALVIDGQISFNGQTHNHKIMLHFYEVTREAKFFLSNAHDYFDRVLANIQFTFLPKEFGIQKKPHHLKKKISVAIGRGIINEYKPEHAVFVN